MRATLFTVGSRGDVQPYVGLGVGLRRAGYDVTVATHEPFRAFVEEHGLGFAPLPGDPRAVLETPEAQEMLRSGVGLVRFARRFVSLLEPWFHELVDAVAPVHARSDVSLYSALAFPVWHLAQVDRTPTVLLSLQPLTPTAEFPAITMTRHDLGRFLNLATHRINQQLFWQPLRSQVDEWRRNSLGLPALGLRGPYPELVARSEPHLHGFSRHLVSRPSDWPDAAIVTGPWFLDLDEPLPAGLDEFLRDGPAPVYIGFGSIRDSDAERLSEMATEATAITGDRLVLGSGWAGLSGDSLDGRVFVAGAVDHRRLFPRMRAVVHHGGAGTTHTAVAAGVPSMAVPFFADQPFWGRRLEALGIGAPPLPRRELTTRGLAGRLTLLRRRALRDQARRFGHALSSERGVDVAIRAIGRVVSDRSSRA